MMLQVVLGAEKRKLWDAHVRRVPAVQENRARLAEVQHGERQVRHTVGHSQGVSKGSRPLRPAAKCSATYEQARYTVAPPKMNVRS